MLTIKHLLLFCLFGFVPMISAQENLVEKCVPFRKGDKWAYADAFSGKLMSDFYDSIGRPEDDLLRPVFYKNGKAGILFTDNPDKLAIELVPPDYDLAHRHYDGYLLSKNGSFSYINLSGKMLAENEKEIKGTHSAAGNQIQILLVKSPTPFSSRVVDIVKGVDILGPKYEIVELGSKKHLQLQKILGKTIQEFIVEDASKQYLALDINFALIPIAFDPESNATADYEFTYEISKANNPVADKSGIRAFAKTCPIDSKQRKSPAKKKFTLNGKCEGDFVQIENVKTREIGLAKLVGNEPSVVLEPVYTNVFSSVFKSDIPNFIVEKNGKFGLRNATSELLPTIYDEILVGSRAYMAKIGNKTHFVMDYFQNPAVADVYDVASAVEVKRIVADDRNLAVMVFAITKTDGTRFYMASNGIVFYER